MKKVLFTATVDSHIVHFHLPYLKYFKNHGYVVHVATNTSDPILYSDKKLNIPFSRKPFSFSNIKAIFKLRKIIKKEHYDLIITNTPMGSVVTRLANKNRSKLVYIAHGFHFYKGAPKKNWLFYYPVEKFLMKYTNTLITINKEDYEFAKKEFDTRVEYMPGIGLDTKKLDKKMNINDKIKLRKKLGINITDFVMIYIGELNKNKNQIFILKCMPYLKKYNIHLLLAGEGDNRNNLEKYIKDNNLERVHLLGYRDDIPKLLQISDLLVSSSQREGLPFNVLEGMYSSLPILVSDIRGNRDLVKDNGFIYINQKDFIKKIELFYSHQLDIQKMGYISNILSNNYLIDKTLPIFDEIINKLRVLHVLTNEKYSGEESVVNQIIKEFKDIDMAYTSLDIKMISNDNHYYKLTEFNLVNLKKIVERYKPDIIDAHGYKASVCCAKLHKNFILISHIHTVDPAFKNISFKLLNYIFKMKKIDKIIGVSNSIYDNFYFKDKIKDKYQTIYNYVDKDIIINKSNEYKWNKKYDVFYLGKLDNQKDPLRFIDIMKKTKKKCVMIGDGPLLNSCLDCINNEGIKNIEILGFIPNPFPIIKKCKIGVMPSLYEGFGLTIVECAILNKPILNSGCDGLNAVLCNHDELVCKTNEDYQEKLNKKYDVSDIVTKFTSNENWINSYKKIYRK